MSAVRTRSAGLERAQPPSADRGLVLDLVVDLPGDQNGLGDPEALDSGGHVDTVAEHPVLVVNDVTGVNADPDRDRWLRVPERFLDADGALDRRHGALEDGECAVTVELQDAPTVLGDETL